MIGLQFLDYLTILTQITNIKGEFSVIIVNDGSTEKIPKLQIYYKNIKSINIINIKNNPGHTRSNATE